MLLAPAQRAKPEALEILAGGEAKRNHRTTTNNKIALRQEREKLRKCPQLIFRCTITSFSARKIVNRG